MSASYLHYKKFLIKYKLMKSLKAFAHEFSSKYLSVLNQALYGLNQASERGSKNGLLWLYIQSISTLHFKIRFFWN